jgi:tetrahydromethanopterin S-methyltransferase subunit G
MSEASDEKRLDRIEEKIDRLSEAMVLIARTDEKLVAMEQKYGAQYERMNRFSTKLDDIERQVILNAQVSRNISTLFWILVTAVTGGVATMLMQFYN